MPQMLLSSFAILPEDLLRRARRKLSFSLVKDVVAHTRPYSDFQRLLRLLMYPTEKSRVWQSLVSQSDRSDQSQLQLYMAVNIEGPPHRDIFHPHPDHQPAALSLVDLSS